MQVLSNKAEGASPKEPVFVDLFESQGMPVRRLNSQRTKEPLSPVGLKFLQYIVELLGKRNVTSDDILLTELVNGFIVEIPRMERSIVFRDIARNLSSVAIRTPTHGTSMAIDGENNQAGKVGEVLLYDMVEREDASGMMMTVVGARNIPKPKINVQDRVVPHWYMDELRQRSDREMAEEREERDQRKREMIKKIKQKFPRAGDFMSMIDMSGIKIDGMRINAIGAIYGITDPEGTPMDRLLLAAKIYGENDIGVLKAAKTVMEAMMETHGRAQRAML